MMDSEDIVDDVNALLKLGVGDAYRLEHIKQAYIQNKTLWTSDGNYLQNMREKYLIKHNSDMQANLGNNDPDENAETIHCWKCGKKSPLGANFCMICGSSLFEVGEKNLTKHEVPTVTKPQKTISLKIPALVGIPVLILIIIGGAYSQGVFDGVTPSSMADDSATYVDASESGLSDSSDPKTVTTTTNSKCGPGTVFDPDTNSCILDK